GRVAELHSVKDVDELGADLEIQSLREPEITADAEVLLRPASLAEVRIIQTRDARRGDGYRTRSEGSGSRVGPGVRVQHLIRIWIDASAVEVLQKKRLAGPHHLARAKVVGGSSTGRLEWKSASIDQQAADLPIPGDHAQGLVREPFLGGINQVGIEL